MRGEVTIPAAAAACIFVPLFASMIVAAQPADSAAYASLRAAVAVHDSRHPALSTAEALADAGLYDEAFDILREHAPGPESETESKDTARKRDASWRVSSGVDYYHLEDFDTAAMTPEELRDYQRLTETPLSVWLRGKSIIRPALPGVEEIAPEMYVSDRKARLETPARFSLPGGRMGIEPSLKAEKRLRAYAAGASFEPASADSSDMGGMSLRLTAGNGRHSDKPFIWSVPVTLDWEHYRHDHPGYEAFVEYRAAPSLEWRPASRPVGGRISATLEYEDYYRAQSDSLDAFRPSVRAEAYLRKGGVNVRAEGAWMGDRYMHASGLKAVDRGEGGFRGEYGITDWLSAKLRVRGMYSREHYGAGVITGAFEGSEIIAEPAVEIGIGGQLTVGPEFLWERRWAERVENRYIWEARQAWEPALRAIWSSSVLEASLRGAFRSETIEEEFKSSFTGDSRSFRAGGDIVVMPLPTLSLNLFADYQYRTYPVLARVTENVSVSASATVKF